MRKQWVSAVVMVALALGITVPAWADCKVQMVLSAPGVGNTATGTAEKKVAAATLKSPAVNKFEVDVHASALHPYAVMVNGGTPTSAMTMVGGIFTDASGVGEFDLKGSAGTCDIQKVKVVDFLNGGKTILTGDFNSAPLDPNDPPEVEVQIETEIQAEVQNELHNIANN